MPKSLEKYIVRAGFGYKTGHQYHVSVVGNSDAFYIYYPDVGKANGIPDYSKTMCNHELYHDLHVALEDLTAFENLCSEVMLNNPQIWVKV